MRLRESKVRANPPSVQISAQLVVAPSAQRQNWSDFDEWFLVFVNWIRGGTFDNRRQCPQILKTYKTKSAEGLSFRMILTLAVGLLLWVVYGVTASSLPIIASNSVALLLILALLAMKLKFDRSPAKD